MPGPLAMGAIFSAVQAARQQGLGGAGMTGMAAGGFASLAKAAVDASGTVGELASTLTGQLMGPLKGVQQLAGEIGKFVELANPAVMKQFTLAMNDAMAVIGHMLTPVMQALTVLTRNWGDALAGLAPVMEPLFDAIGDMLAGISTGFVPMLQAAAPFLQMFVDVMADLIHAWGVAIAFVQGVVIEFLNTLAAGFGMQSRFKKDASATGAARRPAEVEGVGAAVARMFREGAQNMIRGEAGGAKKDQLAFMQEIANAIAAGQATVKQIAKWVQDIAEWLIGFARDPIGTAGEAGAGAVVDIANDPLGTLRRWLLK